MNILQNIEEYISTTFSFWAKGKMLKPCSEQREGDLMMTVYIFGVKYPFKYLYFDVFISPFSFLLFIFLLRGSKEDRLSRLWVFCQCLISLPWALFSIASDCNITIFTREQNLVIETWWSWHWWNHSFLWVKLCLCVTLSLDCLAFPKDSSTSPELLSPDSHTYCLPRSVLLRNAFHFRD